MIRGIGPVYAKRMVRKFGKDVLDIVEAYPERLREVHLQSKNQKPLERYFPEVDGGLAALAETSFVLDGELVIHGGSFEALQLRLHPAASRIRKLSQETPAQLVAFDVLARGGMSCSTGRWRSDARCSSRSLVT